MKHVQAAAALSTAQSILYPSPEDAAQGARTGKKVLHNGGVLQVLLPGNGRSGRRWARNAACNLAKPWSKLLLHAAQLKPSARLPPTT